MRCVYTVCSNKARYVDSWVNSLDTENILAVVHDSKDDTIERLVDNGVKVVTTHYQDFDLESAEKDALEWAKKEFPECTDFRFSLIEEEGYKESPTEKENTENRICVYTTCYNESRFIDKWLENNKDADHIVVLVHDCKDGSEEKFKKAGVSIAHGFYRDWRFDNGKNDSMHSAFALAPECNIFVFTALDELWEPGWADEVKKNWIPGKTQQCWYNFVQTHDEFGNNANSTYFNWMISKDPKWHWKYPVHEAIIYGEKENPVAINLFNKVTLQHWPDKGRPRDYTELHKLRYEEYKDDLSYLYLIRENIIHKHIKEAYELAVKFDHSNTDLVDYENAYIYTMEGICCEYLNSYEDAVAAYEKAYGLSKIMRTPLMRIGIIYAKCGLYKKAENYLKKALDIKRTYSWIEDPTDWRSKPYYWMSYVCLKMKQYEKALGYILFASKIDPTDKIMDCLSNTMKILL